MDPAIANNKKTILTPSKALGYTKPPTETDPGILWALI